MKKFLLLSCFLIAITCQAQDWNFSVHVGANCPIIKTVETDHKITAVPLATGTGYSAAVVKIGVKESFSPKVGFRIGGQFDYALGTKFFLTSGLSVSYLRFQRTVEVTNIPVETVQIPNVAIPVGQPFGLIQSGVFQRDPQETIIWNPLATQKSPDLGNTTSLFLQAPVMLGTSFFNSKFQIGAGAVLSYLLHATEVRQQYTGINSVSSYKETSKEGFSEFQAGAAIETSYLLSQRIGIDFTAQKFFTPIYKSERQAGGEAKYNLLSLGLSYHL